MKEKYRFLGRRAEHVERKTTNAAQRLGFFRPKKGELFFPKFMKQKTRHFSGRKYHQGAYSSDKKTIDLYKKEVLDKSGTKHRITKEGNNYQVWVRKKR